MKNILPIFALCIAVLGCGMFRSDPKVASNTEPQPASSPAAPVKAVDMPSLIGKSRDEMKKIVSVPPKAEKESFIEWDLPQGSLEVTYTKGKQTRISFRFKMVYVGSQTISGLDSAEKLGDMVGIDVHGKPLPTPINEMYYTYPNIDLNGKTVKEVVFSKALDRFQSVAINLE